MLSIGFTRAIELLAMPKRGRGGRTALKDLGKPEGSDDTIQVYDGPYGLYVKQGKVNASLPEGKGADDITLAEAVELLQAKAAAKKGSGRKSGTTKRSTTKKPAASKASTSKSSTSKTATSKTGTSKTATAKTATRKLPGTTKSGRPRAGAVRVIKPADK